jgi:hypothetical protein
MEPQITQPKKIHAQGEPIEAGHLYNCGMRPNIRRDRRPPGWGFVDA